MLTASSTTSLAAQQLPGLLPLWGVASKHLHAFCARGSSSSSTSSSSAAANSPSSSGQWVPQLDLRQHLQGSNLEQQQQQQQHGTQLHNAQSPISWLQQLSAVKSSSKQDRLSLLSRLSITLQGRLTELSAAGPSQLLSTASSLLPKAALAAATTAALAAAAPAGASLASFQGSRYTGSSSLSSPNTYWLRQMGLQDNKVTALLVAANVGCFGMQQVSSTFTGYCIRVGYKVAQGEYWRLLTAAFVHANVLHVGINTLALWSMGRMVEPQLGTAPYLAVYLWSAITGNLLGYWMAPGFSVSMGSSSALFGLLGAFLASSYVNRHSVYTSRAQVVGVLQTLGINLALMTLFGGHMDNWAHLGGFAGGALIGAVVAPRYSR